MDQILNIALDLFKTIDVIELMENYIDNNRPPEAFRAEVDLGYRIDNQSVILYETRPQWNDKAVYQHHDVAKTTFVKKENYWKVFWLRANLQWNPYTPCPRVNTLEEFLVLLSEDKHGCFYG